MANLSNRASLESDMAAGIKSALSDAREQAKRSPKSVNWGSLQEKTRKSVEEAMLLIYMTALENTWGDLDGDPDGLTTFSAGNMAVAAQFAADRAGEVSGGMVDRLRDAVRAAGAEATLDITDLDQRTPAKVAEIKSRYEAVIDQVLSDEIADRIAATEVTRANSAGETQSVNALRDALKIKVKTIWNTEDDGHECPICGALEGVDKDEWEEEFPNGPPGHPNCRCWLTHERI